MWFCNYLQVEDISSVCSFLCKGEKEGYIQLPQKWHWVMEAIAPSQAEQKYDINLPDKSGHNIGNFSVGQFQQ